MNTIAKYTMQNRQEADILIRQLLNIGEAMYQCGSEIHRIEDTLHRLGYIYGATHVSVFAVTSYITITLEFEHERSVTQLRRITQRESFDFIKLEKLNQLCRTCSEGRLSVYELKEKVISLLNEKPRLRVIFAGEVIATAAFAIFFGGTFKDAAVAAIGALVIWFMQRKVKKICSGQLFFNIITSFITGCFLNLCGIIIPGIHIEQIIIGDIMVLIPGVAITNSIRYILSGDLISSFEKLCDSLMQAFGIAAGFVLAIICIQAPIVEPPVLSFSVNIVVQLLSALFGTLGFCMMFNVGKRLMAWTVISGTLGWGIYLCMQHIGSSVFLSVLASALFIGLFGEVMSRILKAPTTLFFLPASIPLIPGRNLYYLAFAALSYDSAALKSNAGNLCMTAFAISAGLALVLELEHIIITLRKSVNKDGNNQ